MEISASLNFIRRQDKKPVFHSSALTGGKPKYFYDTESHTVTISDMREIAEDLSVDREGFELLHHKTAVKDLREICLLLGIVVVKVGGCRVLVPPVRAI